MKNNSDIPTIVGVGDIHKPRPLPDPAEFPYGLVRITVWTKVEDETRDALYSGDSYTSQTEQWWGPNGEQLKAGDMVDWSFDGFHLDYFNRGYLLQPEHKPNSLVSMALWALERWAQDVGLTDRVAGR